MFIDFSKAFLQAGHGGRGCASFRREKYVPLGGPDGGDGGKGGDVIFVADRNVNTLIDFKYQPRILAKNGAHGKGSQMTGKSGKNKIVRVPVGTVMKSAKNGDLIHDFTQDGEKVVVAKGGKGGLGNQHFATSTNQAPRKTTPEEKGESFEVVLELKLMAEVGLVGFPNAGKSTLLSVVSEAKPKIAGYPFTTLEPMLGVVRVDEDQTILMADIPGLIQGAHEDKGLGIQFLRHIERTKVLLFMIDMSGFEGRDPVEDYQVLQKELSAYDSLLSNKKFFIAANKMDVPQSEENLKIFMKSLKKEEKVVFPISAVTQKGVKSLLRELAKEVSEKRKLDESVV